jgi:chemotaxis signal transduction protein
VSPVAEISAARAHLLARAGEVVCALPLDAVRRVVKALPVHPLPGAAGELAGLAEFAGEPLPVLDLARLVGAAPGANPAYPVTIIAWAGPDDARELVGLNADSALEVVPLDADAVVMVEGGVAAGEARLGERVVRVLDLVALGSDAGGRG